MLARSLAVGLVLLASVAHADDKKYTIADLKALVGQNAFKEAFLHIGDISPAQRNAEWSEVAAAAAGGVLGTLDSDDGTTIAAIDQIDRDYPQLLKSPKYTRPRNELGYKGIEGCFAQTNGYWSSYGLENCVKLGLRFVDNSGQDRALALKVAKVARRSMNAYGAVPFFKRAIGGKDTATACKDEDLKLAVVAGLGLPPDNANATESKAIMATCWSDLKEPVVAAFDGDSKSGYVKQNTCDFLMSKKLLSGLQAKQCAKK
ncbi:MAG: hypothetical protein H7138_16785 [Myxococcales bacterium]|nr:hypothetical protein [Myxococcales bacterium]